MNVYDQSKQTFSHTTSIRNIFILEHVQKPKVWRTAFSEMESKTIWMEVTEVGISI